MSNERKELASLLSGIGRVDWEIQDNQLVGFKKSPKVAFNPITAVAHSKRHGVFLNTKDETIQAGLKLGFSRGFSANVYDACKARNNRGYTQILRGRLIKDVL